MNFIDAVLPNDIPRTHQNCFSIPYILPQRNEIDPRLCKTSEQDCCKKKLWKASSGDMAAFLGSLVKSFILPRPSPSYSASVHPGKLVHIPRVEWDTRKENGTFTCGILLLDTTAKFIIIYAHTNAVDVAMMFDEMSYLSKRASTSVLLVEYTGYGISHGDTTERSMNEDVLSAYYYALRHLHVPADRIVLMGRSIGTGPSAQVCALLQEEEEIPALLVLQSPFTSLRECVNGITPNVGSIVSYFGYDWFRTIDVIAQVRCPIMVHHGVMDDTVSIEHAHQLKKVVEETSPPGVLELNIEQNYSHNDLPIEHIARLIDKRLCALGQTRCLQLRCRPYMLANPPIYEYLFCVNERPIVEMDALLRYWNETLHIGSFVYKRDKLYILLTASVSLFAMRCAPVWQYYCESRKRYYNQSCGGATEDAGCSKEEIVKRCLACWGSPLGAYLGVGGKLGRHMIFGAYLTATGSVGTHDNVNSVESGPESGGNPFFMNHDEKEAYLTVAELEFTHGLIKSVVAAVSTAPTFSEEGSSVGVFLQKDVVTRIQTQCERVVAFLDKNEWENMLEVLLNFDKKAPSFLSSKALQYYVEITRHTESRSGNSNNSECGGRSPDAPDVTSLGGGLETIADVEEWLRPWVVSPDTRMQLGEEVPWDYYLLKGRLCVALCGTLGSGTNWREARRITDAWRVVKLIHNLFGQYSRRLLRPSFSAS
uniref:Putative serine peptidase n=1 Tax=Trypanosoma congolense (strain IL3000) TaxID=1068625 RepID=G0UJ80_TRYCI|nr:putative serine peptidase [Trypanosoma congolense IL3000]